MVVLLDNSCPLYNWSVADCVLESILHVRVSDAWTSLFPAATPDVGLLQAV